MTKGIISIVLLYTFNLYVAKFQKYIYMEYISPSWSDIPELVVPIMIPWYMVGTTKGATEQRVPSGYVEVIT